MSGTIASTGVISSTIASGNNGFAVTQNGARIDFGAGANDYATSDGTTVTHASPLAATAASGSNAFSLVTTGSRIDTGSGSLDYIASNGTNTVFPSNELVLSASYTDGLPWTATNVDAVISSQQAFTLTRFVWIGQEGTQPSPGANIQWGVDTVLGSTDGGTCSGSFQCDAVCPDAGIICSIPLTGQCDFSAGQVVLARFLGGNNCTVNPASAAPHVVWGTLR